MAGISSRTLRYYDKIELLKPFEINNSGYRSYSEFEVDRLQQIMFYKERGLSLKVIASIINVEEFDVNEALKSHYREIQVEIKRLEALLTTVKRTIDDKEGKKKMKDSEKFKGFKKEMIEENELKFGKEIRDKYGSDMIEKSNEKFLNMKEETYNKIEELTIELNNTIKEAFDTGNPASEKAQEMCRLHKEWLMHYWTEYSIEAHMGLVQMYVDDERFTKYYDEIAIGSAVFLRDAMKIFTEINE